MENNTSFFSPLCKEFIFFFFVSFPGSEPGVQWSQQSRDQRCLPARQQSPDLRWRERHQHLAVGGCLGNPPCPVSQSGTCNHSHPAHFFQRPTVLPPGGTVSPLCLLNSGWNKRNSLRIDVTADERILIINYYYYYYCPALCHRM